MDAARRDPECPFNPEHMINLNEGSGGIAPRAMYTTGKYLNKPISDAIRREAEQCDSLQGFALNFSTLGGTGGLAVNISE